MVSHLREVACRTDAIAAPLDPGKALAKLESCGNWLRFNLYPSVGETRLARAILCKQHLLCPLCAGRRGARALGAYLKRLDAITAPRPSLWPWLVTLTVKNRPSLSDSFEHLRACHQLLLKRRFLPRTLSVLRAVEAGVTSFEFTNRGNGWHPHSHSVLLTSGEINQDELQREWHQVTGDSFVVDARPFEVGKPAAEGFLEVFKYAVKFGDLTPAQRWEAACTLRGRRLLSSFGIFRTVRVPEELLDETLDELPFEELFYRYSRRDSEYRLISSTARGV